MDDHSARQRSSPVSAHVRSKSSPSRSIRRLRIAALVIAGLLAGFVVLIGILGFFPPGLNLVTLIATMSWAYVGPHLGLAALVALALSAPLAIRRGRTRAAVAVGALSLAATITAVVVTGSIVAATIAAGGSVDPITSLTFQGDDTAPDSVAAIPTQANPDLSVQIFKPARGAVAAPVLMYIHGGGWVSGTAATTAGTARWYAEQGFLVVNVNYRLATANHATWNQAPADVACELAWTNANAKTYGGDARRISVIGDSAGGNLAVGLAWAASRGTAASSCPHLGAVPVPRAVIGAYPVINPGYTYDHGREWLFDQRPKTFTSQYLGGTPSRYPNRLAAISPLTDASLAAPPTLIIEPERDDFVPAEGVYETSSAALRRGVDITLVKVPFTHHSFDALLLGALGDQAKRTIVVSYLKKHDLAPRR